MQMKGLFRESTIHACNQWVLEILEDNERMLQLDWHLHTRQTSGHLWREAPATALRFGCGSVGETCPTLHTLILDTRVGQ
jgi:hypothetical protein